MNLIPAQKIRRKQDCSSNKKPRFFSVSSFFSVFKLFENSSNKKSAPSKKNRNILKSLFWGTGLFTLVTVFFYKVSIVAENELFPLPLSIDVVNSPFQEDVVFFRSINNLLEQSRTKKHDFQEFKYQLEKLVRSEKSISQFQARVSAEKRLLISFQKEIPYLILQGAEKKPVILAKSGKILSFKNSSSVKLPSLSFPNQRILSSSDFQHESNVGVEPPLIINKSWFLANYDKISNSLPKNSEFSPTILELEWYAESGFEVIVQMSYSNSVRLILGTADFSTKLERMIEIWKDLNLKQALATEINLADVNRAVVKTTSEKKKLPTL